MEVFDPLGLPALVWERLCSPCFRGLLPSLSSDGEVVKPLCIACWGTLLS